MIGFTLNKFKAVNALLYIAHQLGNNADFHKTFKIIYFADQKHLSEYGRPIIGDTYLKMDYGPVPSFLRDLTRDKIADFTGTFAIQGRNTIRPLIEANLEYLSETDLECLNISLEENRELSFDDLTKKSHDFAWENTSWQIDYEDMLKAVNTDQEMVNYVQINMLNNNLKLK
jgi:uncharacterized phage-associated protein